MGLHDTTWTVFLSSLSISIVNLAKYVPSNVHLAYLHSIHVYLFGIAASGDHSALATAFSYHQRGDNALKPYHSIFLASRLLRDSCTFSFFAYAGDEVQA